MGRGDKKIFLITLFPWGEGKERLPLYLSLAKGRGKKMTKEICGFDKSNPYKKFVKGLVLKRYC